MGRPQQARGGPAPKAAGPASPSRDGTGRRAIRGEGTDEGRRSQPGARAERTRVRQPGWQFGPRLIIFPSFQRGSGQLAPSPSLPSRRPVRALNAVPQSVEGAVVPGELPSSL